MEALSINRNMGCIEMKEMQIQIQVALRLIETWDVLKWHKTYFRLSHIAINRNMGCIEIGDT